MVTFLDLKYLSDDEAGHRVADRALPDNHGGNSLRGAVDGDVRVEGVAEAVLRDGRLQLADVVGLRVAAAHRVVELELYLRTVSAS